MHFEIKHVFEAPLDQVEAALLDPEYADYLLQHHKDLLELEAKHRDERGQQVVRSVRYRPKPVIEKIGPKRVPQEWFAFLEESTYDRGTHALTFRNVPTAERIRKMLVNQGTVTLRAISATRTERVTSGELKLALPLLLRPLAAIGERIIHAEAVKLLDEEARVMTEWLSLSSGVRAQQNTA